MKKLDEIGRLSFRVEGEIWNAYWCPNQDNMDGKVFMASIKMNLVAENPERKKQFMKLVQGCFTDTAAELGFNIAKFDEHSAPENERSGSA